MASKSLVVGAWFCVLFFLGSIASISCDSDCIKRLSGESVSLPACTRRSSESGEQVGVRWWFQQCSTANDIEVTTTGPDYTQNEDRELLIASVRPSDEGNYQCSFVYSDGDGEQNEVACIQVEGRAVFQTCPDGSCAETSQVTHSVMENFSIDSQVTFSDSGCSNMNQSVSRMKLVHLDRPDPPLFNCVNDGVSKGVWCQSTDRVQVTQGQHKYGLRLNLLNITEQDAGVYNLTVEGESPSITQDPSTIYQTFNLTVLPRASSTPMLVPVSLHIGATATQTFGTVLPTIGPSNSILTPDKDRTTLVSLVSILVVAVACIVVISIGILVCYRRHTKSEIEIHATEIPMFMLVKLPKDQADSPCEAPSDIADEYFSVRFDAEISCTVYIDPPS